MLGNKGRVAALKQKRHEVGGMFSELNITYSVKPNLYIPAGIVKVLQCRTLWGTACTGKNDTCLRRFCESVSRASTTRKPE